MGPVRVSKVIEIAPVVRVEDAQRGLSLLYYLFDVRFSHSGLARPGEACDENVIPRLLYLQAELKRFQGPVLPDEAGEGVQLLGAFKVEVARVAYPTELLGRNVELLLW